MPEARDWQAALVRLDGAYSEHTLRAYRADVRAYAAWCEAERLTPFAGEASSLRRYVDRGLAAAAPNTIRRKMVALRTVFRLLGHTQALADPAVMLSVRRALRRSGRPTAQALGIGAALRDRLIDACPETLQGVRDRALIAAGYDLLARRSELVGLFCEDLTVLPRGAKILIRGGKTNPFGEGRFAYLSASGLQHVQRWLSAAAISTGPLFRPIVEARPLNRPLHPTAINRVLKAAAQRAGESAELVSQLSGHSMRVGAAQDLAIAGRSMLQIMTAGRWKTTSVLASYVRAADVNLWDDPLEALG